MLLNKLVPDTLDKRLLRWGRVQLVRTKQKERALGIGPGIASAMGFLHRNNILFRDLKPSNIGFDMDGNAVLFDFGLGCVHHAQDDRRLTRRTGSARYMAPEVIDGQEYSFPADVHSFGVLLWEVSALQKPYGGLRSLSRLLRQVSLAHARPSTEKIRSPGLRRLLKQCWHPEAKKRPPFTDILLELEGMK